MCPTLEKSLTMYRLCIGALTSFLYRNKNLVRYRMFYGINFGSVRATELLEVAFLSTQLLSRLHCRE